MSEMSETYEEEKPVICSGCGESIDPEWCWCGSPLSGHGMFDNHAAVPMGCRCHMDGMVRLTRTIQAFGMTAEEAGIRIGELSSALAVLRVEKVQHYRIGYERRGLRQRNRAKSRRFNGRLRPLKMTEKRKRKLHVRAMVRMAFQEAGPEYGSAVREWLGAGS